MIFNCTLLATGWVIVMPTTSDSRILVFFACFFLFMWGSKIDAGAACPSLHTLVPLGPPPPRLDPVAEGARATLSVPANHAHGLHGRSYADTKQMIRRVCVYENESEASSAGDELPAANLRSSAHILGYMVNVLHVLVLCICTVVPTCCAVSTSSIGVVARRACCPPKHDVQHDPVQFSRGGGPATF
jgi:hypothetical protein